ncbi:MAG: glycosyltransferase [Methanobrevibacter sp. CfCl-M3]
MKKILFLSPIGGKTNGADISMNYQMKYLSTLGYEIFLITINPNSTEYKDFLNKYKIKHFLLDYTWWKDDSLQSEVDAVRNTLTISEIIDIINRENIDLAITNTANIPQLALSAAVSNIPHLWLIHEFPQGEFSYTNEKYDFINKFSNEILAASDILAENIKLLGYNTHISYFNPFTDVSNIKIQHMDKPTRIVSVNTINGGRKNTLELIKIYEKLKLKFPKLQLLITGAILDKQYYQTLKDYIDSKKLDNIKFLDDYDSNWSNVNELDIFVNTSSIESFSLTMIESLKLGVVMVAADNHSSKSMERLGYLTKDEIYEIGNIEEAANKVALKIKNFGDAKNKALNIQKKVMQEQSIENITQSLLVAIEKYTTNPQNELRYFKNQIVFSSQELKKKNEIIETNNQTLDERLEIITEQGKVLDERLEIITEQQDKINRIKNNVWYRLLKKIGLI